MYYHGSNVRHNNFVEKHITELQRLGRVTMIDNTLHCGSYDEKIARLEDLIKFCLVLEQWIKVCKPGYKIIVDSDVSLLMI